MHVYTCTHTQHHLAEFLEGKASIMTTTCFDNAQTSFLSCRHYPHAHVHTICMYIYIYIYKQSILNVKYIKDAFIIVPA